MKAQIQKQALSAVLTILLCIGLLIVISQEGIVFSFGPMIPGLILWVLILCVLDRNGSSVAPLFLILYAGFFYVRLSGGFKVFGEVFAFWQGMPEEPWIAADVLLFLALMVFSWMLKEFVRFYWARLLLSIAFCTLWGLSIFMEWNPPRLVLVLAAPCVLFTLMETLHKRSKEQSRNQLPMLGIAMFFSLLLLILPVSQSPYPYKMLRRAWKGVERLWEKIDTQLFYRSKEEAEFAMSFNGSVESQDYQNDKKEKSKYDMTAWLDFGDQCILYLSGTTLDSFDGENWTRQINDKKAGDVLNWQYDTAEHIYALWRMDQADGVEPSTDVFRKRRSEITFSKMNTQTLFTLPGLLRIQVDEERYPYTASAGRVKFDYIQKRDCRYTMYFLEENLGEVRDLIARSEGYTYDQSKKQSWGQISGDYSEQFLLRMVQTVQIEEAMAKRYELIQSNYLTLPKNLSPTIRELAEDITKDCTSDYERAIAIENWLKDNFTYTIKPKLPSASEDFLTFMMESREGYCTWFATASAIMLRTVGVPTRYVQGYRTRLHGQNRIHLDDNDTHAWCEAYIQGYGWIIVEATPGLVSSYAAWEEQQAAEGEEAEEEIPEEAVEDVVEEGIAEEDSTGPLLWILGIAAAIIVIGITLWIIRRRRRKLNSSDQMEADLKQILFLLEKKSYIRYPYESLRAFFRKVHWQDLEIDEEIARNALITLEDSIFGGQEPDEETKKSTRLLIQELKKKKKRRK